MAVFEELFERLEETPCDNTDSNYFFIKCTDGSVFYCHRFIFHFCSESDYFSDLCFSTRKGEQWECGIGSTLMREVLRWIYTGELRKRFSWDWAVALANVGRRFGLGNLVREVSSELSKLINTETVLKTLEVAWRFGLEILKKECFAFILAHDHLMLDLEDTRSWLGCDEEKRLRIGEDFVTYVSNISHLVPY